MTINPIEVQELRAQVDAHSPTPWSVRPAHDGSFVIATGREAEGGVVARRNSGSGTSLADAAFIVRAANSHDELVAALSALLAAYEYRVGDGLTPLITNARAALAKAEGRSL